MKRFAIAALAALFVSGCGLLIAQDKPAEPAKTEPQKEATATKPAQEITLTELQSMRWELANRRASDALKDAQLFKVQFDKLQAEYPELEKAITTTFEAICKEAGVDSKKYLMTQDFKKLVLKEQKNP